ncbi:MAG: hypothetical protein AAF065_13225 [Verrucomicrobiota bacterium]
MTEDPELSIRDEANILTALAFRNGPIENLHAGRHDPVLDDPSASRITDDEMKALMINASEQLAKLLHLRETDPAAYQEKMDFGSAYTKGWVNDCSLKGANSPD